MIFRSSDSSFFILPFSFLLLITSTPASTPSAPSVPPPWPGAPLLLQLPAFDAPHAFRRANALFGAESPSMRQSLLGSVSGAQLGIQSIAWAWEGHGRPGLLRDLGLNASLAAFTVAWFRLPLGEAWLHEEWHRAVLTRRGATSANGVYDFELSSSVIAVDRVADADLVRLKEEHPADFTRLLGAGYEGEVESHRLMRRNNFLLGRSSRHDRFLWWTGAFNATAYLAVCAAGLYDDEFARLEREASDPEDRDFTGPDFTAWVRDLRHPDGPYADGPRGQPHPSGNGGLRRFLLAGDLTDGERDYLWLQAGLSLLNLASPQAWGPDWLPGALPGGRPAALWNWGLVHHLAPFGFSLGADVLLRRGRWAWVLGAQGFANARLGLPGLSAELWRFPYALGGYTVFLTAGASAWVQPEELRFRTSEVTPGGALQAGLALPIAAGLEAWVETDAKSEGWVPGNVHLEPALQGRAGLAWRL